MARTLRIMAGLAMLAFAIALGVAFVAKRGDAPPQDAGGEPADAALPAAVRAGVRPAPVGSGAAVEVEEIVEDDGDAEADGEDAEDAAEESGADDGDDAEPEDEEEEKLVDAFDAETDKWMEPREGDIPMETVYKFADSFRRLPAGRKEECLQRALNLVHDDNVMLLAGILMDKSLDAEYVEAVFNDVLNRSEEVKKPILEQIYKDKTHQCWADVAWIFDITGENGAENGEIAEEIPEPIADGAQEE